MAEAKSGSVEEQVGTVTHFFSKISVAIIELTGPLKVGDTIHITGHTTDVTQPVTSMQVEHEQRQEAKAGDAVGVKVDANVREGDKVFLVK
jgi:putative protease